MDKINRENPSATKFELDGKFISVKEASQRYGVPENVILWRIDRNKYGASIVETGSLMEVEGVIGTAQMFAEKYRINPKTIQGRFARGVTGLALVEKPREYRSPRKRVITPEMECANELRALQDAHPEMWEKIEAERERAYADRMSGADAPWANASMNAWRFERHNAQVRSRGEI